MTRTTSRALRRIIAVAAGVAVGVGASIADGTGARAADPPPDVVCVNQPSSITYVPAPGARPITVPACAPVAPAPPAPPAPPSARPRAAATSWHTLADQARQRRQQQIAQERAGRSKPRRAPAARTSSSTSTRRCREYRVEGTDQHGRPRKPLRICR